MQVPQNCLPSANTNIQQISHLVRHLEMLANGDCLSPQSREEIQDLVYVWNSLHPASPCETTELGSKFLVCVPVT